MNIKGLNGRPHPALQGVTLNKSVQKMRSHIKMLCNDLYTFEIKSKYQGGSPVCRLCSGDNNETTYNENITHLLTQCKVYTGLRTIILHQMEIVCASAKTKIPFKHLLSKDDLLCQFILDCTSLNLPARISSEDDTSQRIFDLSRDLCFGINKTRANLIKSMN